MWNVGMMLELIGVELKRSWMHLAMRVTVKVQWRRSSAMAQMLGFSQSSVPKTWLSMHYTVPVELGWGIYMYISFTSYIIHV